MESGIHMQTLMTVIFLLFSASELFVIIKLKKKQQKLPATAAIMSYAVFTTLLLIKWIASLDIPDYVILLSMAAVWTNSFLGYYLNYCNRSKTFDRYLHAYGSFAYALFIYRLLCNFVQSGGSRLYQSLFVFALGVTLGVFFEIFEAMNDLKKGTQMQRGLQDTNTDLAANVIGSLLAGVFAFLIMLQA